MQLTDQHLLLACRRGDQSAWEALVNRYQRLIYTIPRRAGLDEDQAADVFQEVFTTLFEKLDVIEQPDRLQAWLVTTAKRRTWRLVAESRTRRLYPDDGDVDDELNSVPDETPLPEEVLVQIEEQHMVRVAVSSMDERWRKLIE